jgi:hypothetical protein
VVTKSLVSFLALGDRTHRILSISFIEVQSALIVMSVEAACHCGAVRLVVRHAPVTVTSCTCTYCHAMGHLCAYYSEVDVQLPA